MFSSRGSSPSRQALVFLALVAVSVPVLAGAFELNDRVGTLILSQELDARGRPLVLPESPTESVARWVEALDLYPQMAEVA